MVEEKVKCARCGVEEDGRPRNRIIIHHIVPKSEGGADDKSNIMYLCKPCHAKEHYYREKHPLDNPFSNNSNEKPGKVESKFIRIRKQTYDKLEMIMLPRETFGETIERLILFHQAIKTTITRDRLE